MPFREFAPPASGVYGPSNAREWICAGKTVLEHLREANTPMASKVPAGFHYELCRAGERIARQNRLIVELKPACNPQAQERR